MNDAVKQYWDEKIRIWAQTSYRPAHSRGLINRFFAHVRKSIDQRMQTAIQTLAPHVRDRTVLDLGCGVGLLGIHLMAHGCAHYNGLDISEVAVAEGRRLAGEAGLSDRMTFQQAMITGQTPLPDADIVVGLGFLDWLSLDEVRGLFSRLRGRRFLLTYSEQDNSFNEIVHRFYLVKRLQWKRSGVYAYHFRRRDIEEILTQCGMQKVTRIKTRGMRFGVMIHNLDQ
ncbi:MAG: hypothetical protein Kow0059_10790 [Candidatus Sumerlaeia bacterium]